MFLKTPHKNNLSFEGLYIKKDLSISDEEINIISPENKIINCGTIFKIFKEKIYSE